MLLNSGKCETRVDDNELFNIYWRTIERDIVMIAPPSSESVRECAAALNLLNDAYGPKLEGISNLLTICVFTYK